MHNFLAWLNDSEKEIIMALPMLTESGPICLSSF